MWAIGMGIEVLLLRQRRRGAPTVFVDWARRTQDQNRPARDLPLLRPENKYPALPLPCSPRFWSFLGFRQPRVPVVVFVMPMSGSSSPLDLPSWSPPRSPICVLLPAPCHTSILRATLCRHLYPTMTLRSAFVSTGLAVVFSGGDIVVSTHTNGDALCFYIADV